MHFKEISESPAKIEPTQFTLDDDDANLAFTKKQMKRVAEVIRATPDYQLVRTGDGNTGYFLLYDNVTQLSDYVIEYHAKKWSWLPRTVTQCLLWRRLGSVSNRGITAEVFFDILLPRYGAIMSDRLQTEAGHNFWIDRMADAVAKGYKVGLANMNMHKVDWYQGEYRGVVAWVKQQEAFGEGNKYQALRYIITTT